MKNIIIGTAGHIDHGKTTLIKSLTGRETDRLKEEKSRGISIELGFTYFDLPSGRRAGIIDVPGHEKFIKNMLAGISGIDIVILVIAADEGIMPQTKEHLDILNLLGVETGLIAITKIDLVDEEWLELVEEDIKEGIKGSFLEGKDIIKISSINKNGVDELKNTIDKLTEKLTDKDLTETPRLPVDRVFTISGFGTVVTGTLISGMFKVGDEVQIFPKEIEGKIRNIQVHGQNMESAYSGQRVAINISGIKKMDIDRGDIIAPVNSMENSMMLDIKVKILEDFQKIIENRTRLRLYIGATEVLCRIAILDRENLTPGDEGYAQLRLEESIAVKRGDKFILRFYSPMITIGGGVVIDPNPDGKKNFGKTNIEELEKKENSNEEETLENLIKEKSSEFPTMKELSRSLTWTEEKLNSELEKIKEKIKIFKLAKDNYIVHLSYATELEEDIKKSISEYHTKYPLRVGISKEEVRSKYFGKLKQKIGEMFIIEIVKNGSIKMVNEKLAINSFNVEYIGENKEIRELIENDYIENKLGNLKVKDVVMKYSNKYKQNAIENVYEGLLEEEVLIKISEDMIVLKKYFDEGRDKIIEYIKREGKITAGETRETLDTNRKNAIAILETLDTLKITKRQDNDRILLKH